MRVTTPVVPLWSLIIPQRLKKAAEVWGFSNEEWLLNEQEQFIGVNSL